MAEVPTVPAGPAVAVIQLGALEHVVVGPVGDDGDPTGGGGIREAVGRL